MNFENFDDVNGMPGGEDAHELLKQQPCPECGEHGKVVGMCPIPTAALQFLFEEQFQDMPDGMHPVTIALKLECENEACEEQDWGTFAMAKVVTPDNAEEALRELTELAERDDPDVEVEPLGELKKDMEAAKAKKEKAEPPPVGKWTIDDLLATPPNSN